MMSLRAIALAATWLLATSACALAGDGRPPLPAPEEIAKLPPDGGPDWNRLVFEQSPYLQQHAANPVDWFPWGDEAFAKAAAENKPVFLSIGYATCHWCHVMARESFQDEEVAALLNRHFVAIKVDREERPEVDEIYMTACQAMTGSGGWPLTAILDHERRPFFAATYLPKRGGDNRLGLMELLERIVRLWRQDRAALNRQAGEIAALVRRANSFTPGGGLNADHLSAAFRALSRSYDASHGGFGSAPKFPMPQNLGFLLRFWSRNGDKQALAMVRLSLTAMRQGGVYDHLGHGFHRYAVDRQWRVPHFEKMLYDQALLAIAYVEGFQATGEPLFAQTAREILGFVSREMTSPKGGFYSAVDAESEGVEGKFYLWSADQITAVLGKSDAALFNMIYNAAPAAKGAPVSGRTALYLTKSLDRWAADLQQEPKALKDRLAAMRQKLAAARAERVRPLVDDKILTDWNGLMIAAYAVAARALDEPDYATAAARAAEFLLDELRAEDGGLLKRWRNGAAGLAGRLDDYAFLVWGLLELYEADFDPRWLREALALCDLAADRFEDREHGGFFLAEAGDDLLARPKTIQDGALPSGNAVMALNLLRLGRITADKSHEAKAQRLFKAFSKWVSNRPAAACRLLQAADFAIGPSAEIVIAASEPTAPDARALLNPLNRLFAPNKVVVFRPSEPEEPPILALAPYAKEQKPIDGKAAAYVCRNYACSLPTTDPQRMLALLREAL